MDAGRIGIAGASRGRVGPRLPPGGQALSLGGAPARNGSLGGKKGDVRSSKLGDALDDLIPLCPLGCALIDSDLRSGSGPSLPLADSRYDAAPQSSAR